MKIVNRRQYFEFTPEEMAKHVEKGMLVMTVCVQGSYVDIAVPRKAPSRYHLFGELTINSL